MLPEINSEYRMSLTPDQSALLAIVGGLLVPGESAATGPSSPGLTELLRRHHLRPLAHAAGVQGLETESRQCAAIAAFHRRTLEQVGAAFAERDIAWTTIKGAAYAWSLYQSPEHRPMSDLDVLVREEDFERAGRVLRHCGFAERAVSTRTRHAQTFLRASHEIVDLHRNILQPMRGNASMATAWERAHPDNRLPGYWQLDIVDHCWLHIAHMARHEFVVPLIGYVDLQRLIQSISNHEEALLAAELERTRLSYAREVGMGVIAAILAGQSPSIGHPRMRIIAPTLEELVASRHRSRPEQVVKKLVLFPRDSIALGVGWALRTAEDRFIRARSK